MNDFSDMISKAKKIQEQMKKRHLAPKRFFWREFFDANWGAFFFDANFEASSRTLTHNAFWIIPEWVKFRF